MNYKRRQLEKIWSMLKSHGNNFVITPLPFVIPAEKDEKSMIDEKRRKYVRSILLNNLENESM